MIPKTFHRIWFGNRIRPQIYDDYWAAWQELHPDAEFHTWTEDNLPELQNQRVYDRVAEVARSGVSMSHERAVAVQRADVVAYELVHKFGGVYVNCDILPLKPLDELLHHKAFVGMEDDHFACNAVMAGEQGSPFFRDLIDRLPWRFNQYWFSGMEVATGPHHLTDVLKTGAHDVHVLPTSAFYPVHHSLIPYGTRSFDEYVEIGRQADAYAVHMWGHRFQEGRLHE